MASVMLGGRVFLTSSGYIGKGTSALVYDQIFNDPVKLAKYDSVYDRTPREYTDEETGETHTISKPDWFGVMAGADRIYKPLPELDSGIIESESGSGVIEFESGSGVIGN